VKFFPANNVEILGKKEGGEKGGGEKKGGRGKTRSALWSAVQLTYVQILVGGKEKRRGKKGKKGKKKKKEADPDLPPRGVIFQISRMRRQAGGERGKRKKKRRRKALFAQLHLPHVFRPEIRRWEGRGGRKGEGALPCVAHYVFNPKALGFS